MDKYDILKAQLNIVSKNINQSSETLKFDVKMLISILEDVISLLENIEEKANGKLS